MSNDRRFSFRINRLSDINVDVLQEDLNWEQPLVVLQCEEKGPKVFVVLWEGVLTKAFRSHMKVKSIDFLYDNNQQWIGPKKYAKLLKIIKETKQAKHTETPFRTTIDAKIVRL